MNSFSAYLLSKLLAQFSELSMGSTGLSAPSATVPRFVGESYSLAIDFPLYSWQMPQVGTGCLLFNECPPENRLSLWRWRFFTLVQSVISLFSLHPHFSSLKWWQPKRTDSKHLKLEISVPCALADAFQRQLAKTLLLLHRFPLHLSLVAGIVVHPSNPTTFAKGTECDLDLKIRQNENKQQQNIKTLTKQ